MQKQSLNILDHLSKDEQIAYLTEQNITLALQNTVLIKENDALVKDVSELSKDIVSTKRDRDLYKARLDELIEKIKLMNARHWGAKTERVLPEQISLFNDMEAAADPTVPEPDHTEALPKKKRKKKTSIDYSKFETVIIEHELSADERACPACDTVMEEMAIDIKHTLKLIPARLICEEHHRHVYVCQCCSKANAQDGETPVQIAKAFMPAQPFVGSCASPSLLAYIIHQKYSLALPLYRISEDMKRSAGLTLTRQTLANWVIRANEHWLAMLYALMRKRILQNDILLIDETPVQVLKEPERTPAQTSYMWVVASAAHDIPCYIFEYHPSRSGDVVLGILNGWSGTIITDGYQAYNDLGNNITRVSCIIHIRRYFMNVVKSIDKDKLQSMPGTVSCTAIKLINEIIEIDNGFDEMEPKERKEARNKKLKPKMDAFYQWLLVRQPEAMPSMALSTALNYAVSQWPYLENALKDGRLPIDSNRVERSIRPFAIGRRNWLFSDTPRGAHASAAIYSIVSTAKGNGLKPYEYLAWLFEQMPNTENIKDEAVLERFLPWSDEIPQSCRMKPTEAAITADPLDEPILDIDPHTLDEG
jgi:transposase